MLRLTALLIALALPASGQGFRSLEGHGGPIMGVATDGPHALTASFDYAVGFWPEEGGPVWLEGHRAAVNAVAFAGDGRAVSAGDDFSVITWDLETRNSLHVMTGHTGKVMSVKVSPDETTAASAGWDKTVRLWDLASGAEVAVLRGHDGNVNDVAFSGDGRLLYSAAHDGTIREWDLATGTTLRTLVRHGFGINRLVVNDTEGWIAYGALDGGTRALSLADGRELADLTLERRPILAVAMRPDGGQIAVGDGEGFIMIVDTADWSIARDFRAARNGPVWALAYTDGGNSVVAGGIEDRAYIFPIDSADDTPRMAEMRRAFHTDPALVPNGERQFLRKCSVCHTLTSDGARRAGPSLYGVFGRRAGTLEGYAYSDAMRQSDIIWSEETIDKLFELGPDHYTPGSKMPMQQIASPKDRQDLIAFLRRETVAKK